MLTFNAQPLPILMWVSLIAFWNVASAECEVTVDKKCVVGDGAPQQACVVPSAGGEVTYLYEIFNAGPASIGELSVEDDKLGSIGNTFPPDTLNAGDSVSLSRSAFIDIETTNSVFVIANGGACQANDQLTVTLSADADGDGVMDDDDLCPGTVIAESVPTSGTLGRNRWALVTDGSTAFVQAGPQSGSVHDFTTADTYGCSCEQIVDAAGLGAGHLKKGCSTGALLDWVNGQFQ